MPPGAAAPEALPHAGPLPQAGLRCPGTAAATRPVKARAATKTFHSLTIKADSTAGADRRRMFFYGASTLIAKTTVTIDGVNGEVIIEMIDGATLQTN